MGKRTKGAVSLMSRFAVVMYDGALSNKSVLDEFKRAVANKLGNDKANSTLFIFYTPGPDPSKIAHIIDICAPAGHTVRNFLRRLQKGHKKTPFGNIANSACRTDTLVYVVDDADIFQSVMYWFLHDYLKEAPSDVDLPKSGPYMVIMDPMIQGGGRQVTALKNFELITF